MANGFPVFQGGQLTRGVQLRQQRRATRREQQRREQEAARQRQEALRKSLEDLRLKSLDSFRGFAEQAGKAAEAGVDPTSNAIMQARVGAIASLGTFVNRIQGLKRDVIAAGVSEGLPSEEIERAITALPDERAFIENNLPLFDLAVEAGAAAAPEPLRTLTPEEVQTLSPDLPEGTVIQQRQSGPNAGELLLKFEPTEGEDLSAFQEKVQALIATGLDETTALGIAAGRRAVSVNPTTGERQIIDVATGERIGGPVPPPGSGREVPPLIPEDIQTELATGGPGVFRNLANKAKGLFNLDPASEGGQEATAALTTIQEMTGITLQAEVPGRPSKFLLERLRTLTVTPNSLFQGSSEAQTRLTQTKRMIDGEIARMEEDVLPLELPPDVRVETQLNLTQMRRLSDAYGNLLEGFDGEEETDPELQQLLDKHAPIETPE